MSSSSVFPLEIQELRRPESAYRVDVKCFTSVRDIKDQLHKETNYPISRMQLYHSTGANVLRNHTTLHDLGIVQAGHTLSLALVFSTNPQCMLLPAKDMTIDAQCDEMIRAVRAGLRSRHLPAKTDMLDCTGGVYFMKSGTNTPVAVFKPSDEEQGMPNNPKGYAGNGDYGLRPYFKPGEGYLRETAAYIMDYKNFCNVPATTMVHLEHDSFNYPRNQKGQKNMYPKIGSLQQFIPSGDTFEDISHSVVGVLELQKIALLDMRLLNCDRNASNMLAIRKPAQSRSVAGKNEAPRKYSRSSSLGTEGSMGSQDEMDLDMFYEDRPAATPFSYPSSRDKYSDSYALVPIDHGYCLPSHLHIDEYDWAWFHCPHIAMEVQPAIKEYINSIDIDLLLADLSRQVSISADCLYLLRLSHTMVKDGINAGLSLRDIAGMICRTEEDVPSALENVIANAEDNAQRTIEMRGGRRNTTSPSFLKSLQECGAVTMTQTANLHDLLLTPTSYSEYVDKIDDLPSPAASIASNTVIVKQRSVGSPRSAGNSSPPQRISARKQPAASPEALSDTSGYGSASTGQRTGQRTNDRLSERHSEKRKTPTKLRSMSVDEESDDFMSSPSAIYRPFPLRTTPPERQYRVVSSELNLEAFGQAQSQKVSTSQKSKTGAAATVQAASQSPMLLQDGGDAGRASSYSLSSSSRSPLPAPPAEAAPYLQKGATNAARDKDSVSIAYLSSGNIQKLQSSPVITSTKVPDFLFRDMLRPTSQNLSNAHKEHRTTPSVEFGDYFMKDISLPPAQGTFAVVPPPLELSLPTDLPPMGLCSSTSPHSGSFAVRATSKDRISPVNAQGLSGASSSNSIKQSVRPSGSAQSVTSSSSNGSGGGSAGSTNSQARPRPGDPLVTMKSLDPEYLRRTASSQAPSKHSSAPVAMPICAPIVRTYENKNLNNNNNRGEVVAVPTMSASLFASDSDLSHYAGTSYESSCWSQSPKQSPKPLRKAFAVDATTQGGDQRASKVMKTSNASIEVGMSPRTSNEQEDHDCDHDKAVGQQSPLAHSPHPLTDSCRLQETVPLKGCGASTEQQYSDGIDTIATDTECEADIEEAADTSNNKHAQARTSWTKDKSRSNSREYKEKEKDCTKEITKETSTKLTTSKESGKEARPLRSSLTMPPGLSRVTSFAAFESPPLYDAPKHERQMSRMKLEKRKQIATTAEYQDLRLTFSTESVGAMLSKLARSKFV